MQMSKRLRNCLAMLVLAVIVACPVLWVQMAQADETDTTPKAQLYMDYLGLVGTGGSYGPQASVVEKPGFTTDDVNKVFWIGIRVSDWQNVPFLKEGGLHDLELGIEYNSEYVQPCDNLEAKTAATSKSDWAEIVKEYNIGDGSELTWDKTKYNFMADYSSYDASPDDVPGRVEALGTSSWKMQFISIMKNDTVASGNRFVGADGNKDFYLVRLPFKLVRVPTDKPEVFKVSLSPSTFVMTTGTGAGVVTDGVITDTETYAWESQTYSIDKVHNLGNYFTDNGPVNIFTKDEGDVLTELKVTRPDTSSEDKDATLPVVLYDSAETPGFSTDTTEYHTEKLPVGVDKLTITMGASLKNKPTVELYAYGLTSPAADDITSFTPVPIDASTPYKWTVTVNLPAITTTGYNDTIRLKIGEKVYLIDVWRTAKETEEPDEPGEARIELNYGNSPFGLIERMGKKTEGAWDAEKIARAKEEFVKGSDGIKYQFVEGYVPDGGAKGEVYTINAWGNPQSDNMVDLTDNYRAESAAEGVSADMWGRENVVQALDTYNAANSGKFGYVNFDLDSTAIFAFMKTKFFDPGFVVCDTNGQVVSLSEDNTVERTIKFKVMSEQSLTGYQNSSDEEIVATLNGTIGENVIDLTEFDVKPGIYTMEYSYNDGLAKAYRTLIVVPNVGDVDLDTYVNAIDANKIRQNSFLVGSSDDSHRDTRLMQYRVVDVDKDTYCNAIDANIINQNRMVNYYTSINDLE